MNLTMLERSLFAIQSEQNIELLFSICTILIVDKFILIRITTHKQFSLEMMNLICMPFTLIPASILFHTGIFNLIQRKVVNWAEMI